MNQNERKFKPSIDKDTVVLKRLEESDQLRKQKRHEALKKRRNTSVVNHFDIVDNELREGIVKIWLTEPEQVLEGLVLIRKFSSGTKNPDLDSIVKSNIIPKLVEFITYGDYPDHQYEALWILTNCLSGSSDIARPIIENTLLAPYAAELMKSVDKKVSIQAIWCISNIVGENIKYRNKLVEMGVVDTLIDIIDVSLDTESVNTLETQIWTLNNFFRNKPRPLKHFQKCLTLMMKICDHNIVKNENNSVVHEFAYLLSYVSADLNDSLMVEMLPLANKRILSYLGCGVPNIVAPILRFFGNLITGPDYITQKVLSLGILDYLPNLTMRSRYRKDMCWLVSNIAACSGSQIETLMNHPKMMDCIFKIFTTDGWNIKKECAYIASNIFIKGDRKQSKNIVSMNFLQPFFDTMKMSMENVVTCDMLKGIRKLLGNGKIDGNLTYYLDRIEETGGLDIIEKLQESDDDEVYSEAYNIVRLYFNDEEEVLDLTNDQKSAVFAF